jgi:protein O-mannosyl-transferase
MNSNLGYDKSRKYITMLNKINISSDRQKLIIYVVLTILTFAVFWQVNQYDFVIADDNVYVTENSHIQSGITLDGFRWAFSTTYAEFWHPLTWLSFMFDYQVYGLNAGGYHITNVILHIFSVLLLFWFFNRMTGSIWRSAFVAAIFAIHPLRVESVAWISERKDVLSAFFLMLTLCLYVYYTEKPAIKRYLPVLFFFSCALMSKSIVVTLPVMMILLDYWPLRRFESRKDNLVLWQLKEKTPFFVFSAVFSIITIYAQHKPFFKHISLDSRIANATVSFMTYLEKIFWPHDLPALFVFSGQPPVWMVLVSALLIIVISVMAFATVKRLPYLFVGWLWYAVTIAPVIGIIQIGWFGPFSTCDRYTYLPSIGIAIMLAWGISSLIKQEKIRREILFPAGIAIVAVLAVLTWQKCSYWKNSFELSNYALQMTKNEYKGHAVAHLNRGRTYFALGQYQQAIEDFNEAIRFVPDCMQFYNNRGVAYANLGLYQRAIEDYKEAIRLTPNYIAPYKNRGDAYANLGLYQSAIEDYNQAIRLKSDYVEAYSNRGIIHLKIGNNNIGCQDEQKACELGNCTTLEEIKAKGYCR